MSKQRGAQDQSPIDARLSRGLVKSYGALSRRSFLSLLTRKIVGASGVVLAAQVMPFWPTEAEAQTGDPENCGLHGVLCGGSCTSTGELMSWTQCCEFGCGVWRCCQYADVCGALPPGCHTGSGTAWCADGQVYRCTIVSCFTTNYESASQCGQHCANFCN